MDWSKMISQILVLLSFAHMAHAFVEGLYCGVENCYDVLGITRDMTKSEISKAYRKIARKYHPDRNKEEGAEKIFRLAATAYEVLKDEDSRRDYDYMLDNPEEAYYHYYQYYKRRLTPKVDVRYVITVTVLIISVLQYLHRMSAYSDAVKYAMQNPKHRNQALQIIHQEGLFAENNKKHKNKKSKEERKREEERILLEIVEESPDIKGEYTKASVTDTLLVHIFVSPYYFVTYMKWYMRWVYKFKVHKEEYGAEEKEYLTRKGVNMTQQYWDVLDDYSKESYMKKELWVADNLDKYNEEIEEEARLKLAESGRHKMFKRWMKKGGPGQMTFMEE